MFAAPAEQSLEWSDKGIEGSHRFLKKIYTQIYKFNNLLKQQNIKNLSEESSQNEEFIYQLNKTIEKVTDDIDRRQSFNTAIASLMEFVNYISSINSEKNISDVYFGYKNY